MTTAVITPTPTAVATTWARGHPGVPGAARRDRRPPARHRRSATRSTARGAAGRRCRSSRRAHSGGYVRRADATCCRASTPTGGRPRARPRHRSLRPCTLQAALRAAGAAVAATDAVHRRRASTTPSARCARPATTPTRDAGDGLLLLQQRRGRGAPCARRARPGARGDRRLRRAPRQRHRGHPRRRRARADGRASSSTRSIRTAAPCRWATNMVNLPVPAVHARHGGARADRGELAAARSRRFRPQMIFVSAGFDAHRDDELGQLGLVEADYAWITEPHQGRGRPPCQRPHRVVPGGRLQPRRAGAQRRGAPARCWPSV